MVWRFSGLVVCWFGGTPPGVEVWRFGGLEVWRCGGLEEWRCGGVEVCKCKHPGKSKESLGQTWKISRRYKEIPGQSFMCFPVMSSCILQYVFLDNLYEKQINNLRKAKESLRAL